ncbi:hypothetical protein F4861DRAFT_520309 [Xylaria intraflava]|nr:hypothetical protein F4861DRAFT_520309 [Xylaria intraflava]
MFMAMAVSTYLCLCLYCLILYPCNNYGYSCAGLGPAFLVLLGDIFLVMDGLVSGCG